MKHLCVLFLLFPFMGFAQTSDDFIVDDRRVRQTNEGDNRASLNQGSSQPAYESTANSGEDLEATGGFQGVNSGALENANSSQGMSQITALVGLGMAASFGSICPTLHGSWACAPAAMSAMDALSALAAGRNSAATGASVDPSIGYGEGFDDLYTTQANDILTEMQGLGYIGNEDGSVTLPSGETVTSQDFASAEALAKKGFSPKQAKAAMAQMAGIKEQAAKKAGLDPEATGGAATSGLALGGGAAGSAFSSGGVSEGDQIIEEIEYRGKKKKKENRMPASKAAEFARDFNGTPIGIGMANLFYIVHKNYSEKKKKRTEFINKEY